MLILLKKFLAEYKQAQTTNPQMAEQYQGIYNFWTFYREISASAGIGSEISVIVGRMFDF